MTGKAHTEGGFKLERLVTHAAAGATVGSLWGALIGLVFLMPAAGAIVGAASGAVAGTFVGVVRTDDANNHGFGQFGQQFSAVMVLGSSAVLMLVYTKDPDGAIATLKQYSGRVLRSTLPDQVEAQLHAALSQLPAKRLLHPDQLCRR
ncbi:MAG TPA: DUF1269 domain-containing protein [Thermomicrobiales bacterium]|nr:DUF1269 domain-containing protein [Thermomicrobiales bacterium]